MNQTTHNNNCLSGYVLIRAWRIGNVLISIVNEKMMHLSLPLNQSGSLVKSSIRGVLLARVQSVPRHVTGIVLASSMTTTRTYVCKRCKQRYKESENSETACRYHPLNWSGGEKAKAIGFLRESDSPEHSLAQVHGTGMLQFWDCCGQTSYSSPGCCVSWHVPFGTETDDDVYA